MKKKIANTIGTNQKSIELDHKLYTSKLEKENYKLHSKISKLRVENLTKSNEIKTLKIQIAKLNKNQPKGPVIYLPYNSFGPNATHQQLINGSFKKIKKC